MYKVFIQNKPLTFIHSKNVSKFSGIFLSESVANSKKELILNELKKDSSTNIFFIFSKNPLKTLNNFFNNFKFIEASGGIVKRKQKYLFIKRNDVWDLPKGKVEKGEKIDEAAIREIHEECGVLCKKVNLLILETYHIYNLKGKNILKKTYWFEMNFKGKKDVLAQKEEGITKVEWLKFKELKKVKKNTYPSIIDVLEVYFKTELSEL